MLLHMIFLQHQFSSPAKQAHAGAATAAISVIGACHFEHSNSLTLFGSTTYVGTHFAGTNTNKHTAGQITRNKPGKDKDYLCPPPPYLAMLRGAWVHPKLLWIKRLMVLSFFSFCDGCGQTKISSSPVRVEVHVAVASMLPEEAQVLLRARPAQKAKGVLLWRSED